MRITGSSCTVDGDEEGVAVEINDPMIENVLDVLSVIDDDDKVLKHVDIDTVVTFYTTDKLLEAMDLDSIINWLKKKEPSNG